MTDMRATERLLEVIEEQCANADSDALLWQGSHPEYALEAILEAVQELRRRGDTLVRADDLRRVLATAEAGVGGYASGVWDDADEQSWREAVDRLENALGGVL